MANEKSELLTIYDENLNPIGEKTRTEVHDKGLLYQTIRLWTIQDNMIWFQKRSENKALFPGRLDLSATGHIDPGENPETAVRRETSEEIGLNLSDTDVKYLKGIPFPFTRPDGKLDNEFANIFLYRPKERPCFRISSEVAGIAAISVQDYDKLIRTGEPVKAVIYKCDPEGKQPPLQTRRITCGVDDFCCLNKDEWSLIQNAISVQPAKERELDFDKTQTVQIQSEYEL